MASVKRKRRSASRVVFVAVCNAVNSGKLHHAKGCKAGSCGAALVAVGFYGRWEEAWQTGRVAHGPVDGKDRLI